MTNVVSISSLKRLGAIPIYLDIQHRGPRSVVTLIDPKGWHTFNLTANKAEPLRLLRKPDLAMSPPPLSSSL